MMDRARMFIDLEIMGNDRFICSDSLIIQLCVAIFTSNRLMREICTGAFSRLPSDRSKSFTKMEGSIYLRVQ